MLNLSMKPTGWFQIGWSGEIPPGGVKPMKYFGHDMVAFRTDEGELSVLDAHCPHMGAHLGYGGKVNGKCIACPYHGWEWGTEGQNTLIPGEERKIPKKMRKFHVLERHGIIFLWHDPSCGAPARAGSYRTCSTTRNCRPTPGISTPATRTTSCSSRMSASTHN